MKIGDLVRPKRRPGRRLLELGENDWIGMIIDFHVRVDNCGETQERYAVVCWNTDFPQEEEYLEQIEVINENR